MQQIGAKIAKLIVAALMLAVMLMVAAVAFNALMPIDWSWKVALTVLVVLGAWRLGQWAGRLVRYNP